MSSLFFSFFFSLIIKPLFKRSKEPFFFHCPKLLIHIYLFSHCLGPLSHMAPQMSSLFLLWLLFYYYWRKFSSARCSARISLWRSLTRCRAAFSLLSLRLREGFWKYLFLLRSLSVPSFIMRFLSFVTALSALSWRLSFTVSIWFVFGWGCVCSCNAATRSLFSLHEYCITTCWVCQVAWRRHQVHPDSTQRPLGMGCSGVPFRLRLVALWYVWPWVWVVECWFRVD